ncbi:hypothetical protein E8E12_003701 [Didymella heteroderae]|uniref:Uncharacterized protein n=1 Tax=Didymella heteroderae TaxID=1769908 RepID=A0A9P4WJ78_9PLEO|nr:hypothetical protein E8E12_003701 [Didymella heteroderae]
MSNLSLLRFAALGILASSTLAQDVNTTTPLNGTCMPPRYDVNAPVNASAVVAVNITSEPWYLTVSLNDTRTNTTARTSVDGWLSTPATSTSRTCVYWLTSLLSAPSGGTPNGGCTGSLSENCVDFMRRSIVLGGRDDCPSLPSREDFGKACGGSALADGYQAVFTSDPLDVSNATCRDARIPGADQPPTSYTNHALFGVEFGGDETSDAADPDKFTWYNRYVTRPMPWLVAVDEGGETKTRVVCVAPRNVQGGNQRPETGVASKAGRIEVGLLGLGVVGVVLAVL